MESPYQEENQTDIYAHNCLRNCFVPIMVYTTRFETLPMSVFLRQLFSLAPLLAFLSICLSSNADTLESNTEAAFCSDVLTNRGVDAFHACRPVDETVFVTPVTFSNHMDLAYVELISPDGFPHTYTYDPRLAADCALCDVTEPSIARLKYYPSGRLTLELPKIEIDIFLENSDQNVFRRNYNACSKEDLRKLPLMLCEDQDGLSKLEKYIAAKRSWIATNIENGEEINLAIDNLMQSYLTFDKLYVEHVKDISGSKYNSYIRRNRFNILQTVSRAQTQAAMGALGWGMWPIN